MCVKVREGGKEGGRRWGPVHNIARLLNANWVDADWLDQIVFILLFGNKRYSFIVRVCYKHTQCHLEGGSVGTSPSTQQNKRRVDKRLCWNLSKANNHCGAGEDSISAQPINITLLWLGEYIQDSSNWCCKFWCCNGSFICRETRQQLLFNYWGCVWIDKNKEIQQDKWTFIWLK